MPEAFDKSITANVLITQKPKLQTDVREQRKKESFQLIFYALERRLEDNSSSKP